MLLNFDPVLRTQGNTRLSSFKGWIDPSQLADQITNWWPETTSDRVQFQIVKTRTVDTFPAKTDGYTYDESQYLATVDPNQCGAKCAHIVDPNAVPNDLVDYLKVLQDYNVCDALNAGDIDDLWMIGGPYFGFYESRLAGPNPYWYNSPPLERTSCNKLLPIMGFSYERELPQAIHDFGHRAESALAYHFGGLDKCKQNEIKNDCERFTLTASLSPHYGFSGCGTTHRPPTATGEYEYDAGGQVPSMCEEFARYPNMKPVSQSLAPITCEAWGCSEILYYRWWFQHLPAKPGVAPDGHKTDWLRMAMDPAYAR
jgi:hypothetical protein